MTADPNPLSSLSDDANRFIKRCYGLNVFQSTKNFKKDQERAVAAMLLRKEMYDALAKVSSVCPSHIERNVERTLDFYNTYSFARDNLSDMEQLLRTGLNSNQTYGSLLEILATKTSCDQNEVKKIFFHNIRNYLSHSDFVFEFDDKQLTGITFGIKTREIEWGFEEMELWRNQTEAMLTHLHGLMSIATRR